MESGLDRWVNFEKSDFVGREALQAEYQVGSQREFVSLTLDDPTDENTDPFGEAVYLSVVKCDGIDAGLVVSAGYGHRVRKSIAMAVVDSDKLSSAKRLSVIVVGREREAHRVFEKALYDPANAKLRD